MVAKKTTEKQNTIAFEDRVERLQEIVEALEQGNVSLADSIDLYKEGLSHTKLCREELEKAQHEIQILSSTAQPDPAQTSVNTINIRDCSNENNQKFEHWENFEFNETSTK